MTTNIIIILLGLIALLLWEIEKSLGKIARRFGDKGLSWKINALTNTSPLQFVIEPVDEADRSTTPSEAPHRADQHPSRLIQNVP